MHDGLSCVCQGKHMKEMHKKLTEYSIVAFPRKTQLLAICLVTPWPLIRILQILQARPVHTSVVHSTVGFTAPFYPSE